jgi:membrane protease subunit (stomatin/prohibitin family)
MSLWNMLKQHAGAQFMEVIDWTDDTRDTIVYRYPTFNQAITDNSKLVVREGQAAVFVSEGQLSEVFGPGTYSLDTRNAPILRFFQSIMYKMEEPYKGDILFVNTTQFTDNGWGTPKPFMLRDAEFGPVRIRAFGIYSFRITDPATFIRQIVGTDGLFTTDEITGQLKKKLVSTAQASIAKARMPILDLAMAYGDLGDGLRTDMNPTFQEAYGITITDFTISNISLPDEVEKALDNRSKMGILGDLNAYTQLKAADAIETAAANTGIGGMGVGMGVGFGMGNQVGAQMGRAQQFGGQFNPHTGMQPPPQAAPPPLQQQQTYHYNGPSGQSQLTIAQLVEKIVADRAGNHMVWQAGWPGWKNASEVPEITAQIPPAPAAPPPLPGQEKLHYNGPAGQGEKSMAEIVQAVKAAPDAVHHVWKAGWPGWKPATEVPEIAALLGPAGPPPLPPPA